ncbi:MAG: hypothetical protein COB66_04335 [Coxiella sp. (in: Bacteria)]|nr:MAG: hypothetical protein COB66_04335 [Coxiella sp. (in: g-proteobacteria)]
MVHCTHTSIFEHLSPNSRLIGLKANASALPLHQLDQAEQVHADAPEEFASALLAVKKTQVNHHWWVLWHIE